MYTCMDFVFVLEFTCNFNESGVFFEIYCFAQEITWSYARSFELNADHTSN